MYQKFLLSICFLLSINLFSQIEIIQPDTIYYLDKVDLISNKVSEDEPVVKETIYIEQEILKEKVGIQDQIQVCHGGFNITTIFSDSSYSILSLNNSSSVVKQIDESLILVFSGIVRNSSDIHKEQIPSVSKSIREKSLKKINSISEEFASKLTNHTADFQLFTSLL